MRKNDAKQNNNSASTTFENESIIRLSLGRHEGSTWQERTSQITVPPTILKESTEVRKPIPETEGKRFGAWDFDDALLFGELRYEYGRLAGDFSTFLCQNASEYQTYVFRLV